MSNFQRYSAFYDLLYADKDYAAEADYVARALGSGRALLELGSGTGRHGQLLAARGFDVLGVELSAEMAAEARSRSCDAGPSAGSFACEVGDLRSFRAGRTFDAVISLFHVISYQTGNDDLAAAFATAAAHLAPGGVFLFDVWHGPAVLTQQPTARAKEAADAGRRVWRTATPTLDTNLGIVRVDYEVTCEDLGSGETTRFRETHLMRYLFPTEIGFFAAAAGFEVAGSEEFLTGRPPSPDTWGVAYVLRKR
jgi:SAM-dependent methyltransferase